MHDHADDIFDRSPIGMTHWNVHVRSGSALQSAIQSFISRLYCRIILNRYIPVYHTNGQSIKHTIGMVVNRLVGMGLHQFWILPHMQHALSPIPTRWCMTMRIIVLIVRPLVWDNRTYMFDMNWRYNRRYNQQIVRQLVPQFRSNVYIPVSHTNGLSIKQTIGVVVNRLVGMVLMIYTGHRPTK